MGNIMFKMSQFWDNREDQNQGSIFLASECYKNDIEESEPNGKEMCVSSSKYQQSHQLAECDSGSADQDPEGIPRIAIDPILNPPADAVIISHIIRAKFNMVGETDKKSPIKTENPTRTSAYALKHLNYDMVDLRIDAPRGITAIPMDDDIFLWKISILGPENSPFEGRFIQGAIQFTAEYPYAPPTVRFSPTVFHPNISESGDVCLSNDIRPRWTPRYTLSSYLVSIQYLLAEPSTLDRVNSYAAGVLNHNSLIYEDMAWQSALQHKIKL